MTTILRLLGLTFTFAATLATVQLLDLDSAQARNKIDLDDVQIKGELHNDGQLRIVGREDYQLKNYVRFRTNYRQEAVEDLPRAQMKVRYKYQ
ncbi:MAG: hypothetical protein H6626_01480 [Pseudobdellovibrionaceae bacterium]|nr:hypothetical protein [Bdellovibrionales bacterium]USN47790.1 MAG: hypothetical protein H6626_01480 [Pseudobdellovibrionaceae bacterium]